MRRTLLCVFRVYIPGGMSWWFPISLTSPPRSVVVPSSLLSLSVSLLPPECTSSTGYGPRLLVLPPVLLLHTHLFPTSVITAPGISCPHLLLNLYTPRGLQVRLMYRKCDQRTTNLEG